MRTSPEHVQRPVASRVLSLVLVVLLAVVGTACGDDGPEQTSPTTTAPATTEGGATTTSPGSEDGTSTTADGPTTTTAPSASTAPGDPAGALTPAEAEAELTRILEGYRAELQGAKQRNALDEQFRAGLASVLLPALRDNELDVLQRIGAPGSLAATIAPVAIGTVAVRAGDDSCASGTARIDFTPFYGAAAAGPKTYFYKLTNGGDADGGWRLAAIGFTESGQPFAAAECEEQSS